MTIPDKISIGRLVMALFMMLSAGFDARRVFLTAFSLSLVSDFVDGLLARRLHQESKTGAMLDTWGDVTMYIAAAVGGWFLWPDRMQRESAYIITVLSLVGFSGLLSLLKHHKLPSYHTWSAKSATAVIGIAALLMFAGVSPIPFRMAVILLAVSTLEEIAITLVLPDWRPDVRSLFCAMKLRREAPGDAGGDPG